VKRLLKLAIYALVFNGSAVALIIIPVYGTDLCDVRKGIINPFDVLDRGDSAVDIDELRKELEKSRQMEEGKEKEELRRLKELAEKGDAEAQTTLGLKYIKTKTRDGYKEGFKWFSRAANQGNTRAQVEIGHIFKNGKIVVQNYDETLKWYRKAAEQGDYIGQFSMGLMYFEGKGVAKNYIEAHKWFNIATSNGCDSGMEYRNHVAFKMTPEQIAKAQKLAHEWKPQPAK